MKGAFEPPADRQVFAFPVSIAPEDIDENGHVNNVVYVRWLQDAGTAHWRHHVQDDGPPKWSWVALRHEIDYLRALKLGDPVIVRTWVGTPRGARFDRFVVVEGPQGPAAQGRTEWCLVDAATMRPARIPPGMVEPFILPD
ncbi:MAG: acyl-CoA thioesterase [Caulobacteraceae bacterium]